MVAPRKAASLGRVLGLAVTAFAASAALHAAEDFSERLPEYKIKAAYLYYFATFVAWPEPPSSPDASAIVIGILGDDPFGDVLEDTVRDKKVGDRPIRIRRFESLKEARQSHILFVPASERDNLPGILSSLEGTSVLLVGESPGFASNGGHIGFVTEAKKVRFEISLEAVKRSGLKMSAQLIKVGKVVEGGL